MQFIFDTNYYRGIVFGKELLDIQKKLFEQKDRERLKGHEILFPNIVAIELISHLKSGDNALRVCYTALHFLANHCNRNGANKFKGTYMPTYEDLISFYFFQTPSDQFGIVNRNLNKYANDIGGVYNIANTFDYRDVIKEISEFKKFGINNLISNIEKHYLPAIHPNKISDKDIFNKNAEVKEEFERAYKVGDYHKWWGLVFLSMAMQDKKIEKIKLTKEEFQHGFLNDFKVSIDFFVNHVWRKVADTKKVEYFYSPETDGKKRWNSYYDMQLIFATEFENYKNRNTILVTTERKIQEAFAKMGKENLVISPGEYQELLEK